MQAAHPHTFASHRARQYPGLCPKGGERRAREGVSHTPRAQRGQTPTIPRTAGGGGHVLLTGAEPQNPNCIFPPCAHRLLPQEKPSTRRQATATRTFRTLAAALSQQPAEHKPGDPPQETRQQTTARSGNADPPQQNLLHRWHGLREHHATPSDKPLCAREDLTDV